MLYYSLMDEQCIICMLKPTEKEGHLVCPQTHESWETLFEAAKVRMYNPIINAAKSLGDNEIPKIYYHRKCRSVFTMKRDLNTLKRKANTSPSDDLSFSAKRMCRRPPESRVYDAICIFCNEVKFIKSSKTREKLTQAVQLRADQTLRECAIHKGDEKILTVTSRDIVAAEAHYHHSCYKNYTRVKIKDAGEKDAYEMAEREAYANLFEYIRSEIIPKKEIVSVAFLCSKLESFMLSCGIDHLHDSTRKHIHRKLLSELANSVNLFTDDKGKLLMVPDSITLDVAVELQSLRRERETWKAKVTDLNKIVDQASLKIRLAIKEGTKPTPWPHHPSDASSDVNLSIPPQLERFLIGLLTGDPNVKSPAHRISTLVQSISQDIIYAVTCGKHKPPKHLLLPYAVKTLTGNVEIIRMLNKFGHGVSYSQLEENDTALCLQKLATSLNRSVVLPASIQPGIFTNLAWDNID